MTLPNPTEHVEAVRFIQLVRMHAAKHPDLLMLVAVPNGERRTRWQASQKKAEGIAAGYPDYALDVARGGFHGLRVELKSMTGYASREQKVWIERLRNQGYRAEVCRGAYAAWSVVCDYLGIVDAVERAGARKP